MDISYQEIQFECPNCGYVTEVLLRQVMAEETILCPGCYIEIQLVDEGGSFRRAQSEIDEAFTGLQRTLRRLRR